MVSPPRLKMQSVTTFHITIIYIINSKMRSLPPFTWRGWGGLILESSTREQGQENGSCCNSGFSSDSGLGSGSSSSPNPGATIVVCSPTSSALTAFPPDPHQPQPLPPTPLPVSPSHATSASLPTGLPLLQCWEGASLLQPGAWSMTPARPCSSSPNSMLLLWGWVGAVLQAAVEMKPTSNGAKVSWGVVWRADRG